MATNQEMFKTICQGCVMRAEAMGYRGKRRDDFALDYLAGAYQAAIAMDNTGFANHIAAIGALLVATRGYDEVKRIATEEINA